MPNSAARGADATHIQSLSDGTAGRGSAGLDLPYDWQPRLSRPSWATMNSGIGGTTRLKARVSGTPAASHGGRSFDRG